MRGPLPVGMPSAASSTTASKSSRARSRVGGGPADQLEELVFLPLLGRRHLGDDLLGQDVERGHRGQGRRRGGPCARRPASAAHSTSSSRVVGKMMPSGTPWREWLERPTRCRKVKWPAGEPDLARQLDRPDVDAELEGRRRYQGAQVPRPQAGLGPLAPLGGQAAVVGGHLVGAQDLAQEVGQALGKPPGVHEHQGRAVALDVLGDALDYLAQLLLGEDGSQLLLGQLHAHPHVRGGGRSRLLRRGERSAKCQRRGVGERRAGETGER